MDGWSDTGGLSRVVLSEYVKLPSNRLAGRVLRMVLRRELMSFSNADLVSTACTPVDASKRSGSARRVNCIKRRIYLASDRGILIKSQCVLQATPGSAGRDDPTSLLSTYP